MIWISGGTFLMGSDRHYPEEGPPHPVRVDGFWIDERLVTNDAFARFVAATGYVTVAERPPDPADYPGVLPELLVPGSVVFRQAAGPVDLAAPPSWWEYVAGACWHAPEGPSSTVEGRGSHPVVHVCLEDALAYATWAGKSLPTEAQWEYAARGGLEAHEFSWGDDVTGAPHELANVWQGEFPWENRKPHPPAVEPAGSYPPNGYGLYDMAGNAWEWTLDYYHPRHVVSAGTPSCCAPRNPTGAPAALAEAAAPAIPLRVLKGGSFLCADNYCLRYRPAARIAHASDSASVHIGFRCVRAAHDEAREPTTQEEMFDG